MKLADAREPLKIFEDVMRGGPGIGHLGVIMSRHGTGKGAVLTSIALDHAMDGRPALHVAVGKSVADIRALHDAVIRSFLETVDVGERVDVATRIERNKQIHAYRDGAFRVERLDETLAMLAEHAAFAPHVVDISGWPDFRTVTRAELEALRDLARRRECEVWLTAQTYLSDPDKDPRGVPGYVREHEDLLEVMIVLEPEGDHVNIRFAKTHADPPPDDIRLELDPTTQLIRRH